MTSLLTSSSARIFAARMYFPPPSASSRRFSAEFIPASPTKTLGDGTALVAIPDVLGELVVPDLAAALSAPLRRAQVHA
jgi:hypothetical protein